MKDICYQCGFIFEETSIQMNRRLINHSEKICQSCYRINHAEERAKKRHEIANLSPEEQLLREAKQVQNEYGSTSPWIFMRKFKLTFEQAVVLCDKVNPRLKCYVEE